MTSQTIRNRSIDEISEWDAETDVLVIGLGCAGGENCSPFALFDCSPEETIYAAMTLGGLRTSKDGEVLTTEGQSIPGLYAAGRTAALFTGRGYSGSGISLSDASFYGRRAGRAAAARKA